MARSKLKTQLLDGLNDKQRGIVQADLRRLLVIAGAGSGKTEVMARRIAWWVGVEDIDRSKVVAFTFTERAAEEMKFRIRRHLVAVTPSDEDVTLGGMYVGTIHGFCLQMLRELRPDAYHNYDILDEGARLALVQRGYNPILGLRGFQTELGLGQHASLITFLKAYDLLNEYCELDVKLPSDDPPYRLEEEKEWCKEARLKTKVGIDDLAKSFATSAARLYAYLRCRRFLDFSTSQSELVRLLEKDKASLVSLNSRYSRIVVDEVQDINPVQERLISLLVGSSGSLTAVGDHRQGIYRFRGSRVELMARLAESMRKAHDSDVRDLTFNYRSTPKIITLANKWSQTIGAIPGLTNPDMEHGNKRRLDEEQSHTAVMQFTTRSGEAKWIAESINHLVNASKRRGAFHDTADVERGIAYGDIAVLLRSSTDARLYMKSLQKAGIPAVVRAGPDLFSQPEVLLFLAAFARSAGIEEFWGGPQPTSLPGRINTTLRCKPTTKAVITAAVRMLKADGIAVADDLNTRMLLASKLIQDRLSGTVIRASDRKKLKCAELAKWVMKTKPIRRVFPQTLYHLILEEAGVADWGMSDSRTEAALFHLGQLSTLVKGIEAPGWNSPSDFKYQLIALALWGTSNARSAEAPFLVPPDAVTISTIHGVKGLEFAAVFLADVSARRFPSNRARTTPTLPFDGKILKTITPSTLSDNDNYDDERRLMYVALTRAERYLFVSHGSAQVSRFFREVSAMASASGLAVRRKPAEVPGKIRHLKTVYRKDIRLVTSFSDLRYYLECPHDFYLRKVLGFTPTIDQAFGYGRGVHNIMRAIHTDPKDWAKLAGDPKALNAALDALIQRGLMYLRYTTGEPLENMQKKAKRIIADYVRRYASELDTLAFEPEKAFESLIEEEQILISGAIDVIRLDDPPRVTLVDFKSGHKESDVSSKLDEEGMRLQVSIYAMAAKKELEYEPERGLVRYLDEGGSELDVDLNDAAVDQARKKVITLAANIRDRKFQAGPIAKAKDREKESRCQECDFLSICSRPDARKARGLK